MSAHRPPLALYLHLPFCEKKCGYCDFNSVAGMEDRIPAYMEAIGKEMGMHAWASGAVPPSPPPPLPLRRTEAKRERGDRPVAASPAPLCHTDGGLAAPPSFRGTKAERERGEIATIFIGGGTPTVGPVEGIARLLDLARTFFDVAPDAEITCEANPGSSEVTKFAALREAGVNRLSIGIQSLDDGELRTLGRVHTASEAEAALRAVRAAGFERWNADLIFAVPGQTRDSWRRTLDRVLSFDPPHVAAYSLTYEEGTPFHTARRDGRLHPTDEETDLWMYEHAIDTLAARGIEQYEISNFARPGSECRHNRMYWESSDYIGCGAGAHGFVGGERWMNVKPVDGYIAKVQRGERPTLWTERPTPPQRMFETMFCGLRTRDGVGRAAFAARFGVPIEEVYPAGLARCLDRGWMEETPSAYRLTRAGLRFADSVFVEFATVDFAGVTPAPSS